MIPEHHNTRNPILPLDIHIPDAEAHVMPDGKLYLYGSLDTSSTDYCSGTYRVASTADMQHWTVSPISLQSEDIIWNENIDIGCYPDFYQEPITPLLKEIFADGFVSTDPYTKGEDKTPTQAGKLLFAPDAIYANGQYYLYFCMSDASEGVAVSDSPNGPFTNAIKLPCRGIDPAIFIDDDGQGYYYWGQFYSHAVRLSPDLVSFQQEDVKNWVLTEQKHFFHEGSSMRKIGDTYYAVYADMERGKPTAIGYSTSSTPLGPFTYGGIIVDNATCDPESWNNHGSIFCFQEEWYVAYHRCSRNSRIHRRLCIERITIQPDGSIPEVPMTSQGVGAPFQCGETIMGYQACGVSGTCYIDLDETFGEALYYHAAQDIAVFRYVENDVPYQAIGLQCEGSGTLEVSLNDTVIGCYDIADGMQQQCDFHVDAGHYTLQLKCLQTDGLKLQSITLS